MNDPVKFQALLLGIANTLAVADIMGLKIAHNETIAAIEQAAERLKRLEVGPESALEYAISVIESYEMCIRLKPELMAEGFCQGRIYGQAVETIRRKAGRDGD